ncbi:MAG TPA: pilus assembly protein TadG-related protein [Candidatus Dormibacteraeota bacterium]
MLTAIFAMLLLGVIALATDLSVSTHYKRSLQNVTDAAALAGAVQLPAGAPSTGPSGQQGAAALAALKIVNNAYQWIGSVPTSLVTSGTCSSTASVGCSITVCAGMTSSSPACTLSVGATSNGPFVLTVNTPPRTARIISYNNGSDTSNQHRVEVYMRQQTGGFFTAFVGGTDQDAAQSVGYHFAAGQPFPFALFSRTIVQDGNQGEVVQGNMYSARYVQPQSSGKAGICAGPDPNGNPGYIFLGYPQVDDGSAYNSVSDPGQSTITHGGFPITDNFACTPTNPPPKGVAAMSADPASTGCTAGFPDNNSGSAIYFDNQDMACEANPTIQPPTVAKPSIPANPTQYCSNAGFNGTYFLPGEYTCNTGTALTVDNTHLLKGGIYQIDASGNGKAACDVNVNDTGGSYNIGYNNAGVTFYLKGSATLCFSISSGDTITQTAYNSGSGASGDGRYAVLSDEAGAPSIVLGSSGGGSGSGFWNATGVIWLPTGSITFSNKDALQDDGQVVVNSWNDSSGNHDNSTVTYDQGTAPPQNEVLALNE